MDISKALLLISLLFVGISLVLCEEEPAASEDKKEETTPEENTDESSDAEDSSSIEEENDVLVLTKDNFDEAVQNNDIILVEFYAPWCGHCKALAPTYEKAAARLKENDPPIALAKVDATVHTDLGSKYEVSGYPTLKFFKSGQVHSYDGPRDEDGIVAYMQERADPNWKPPPEAVITLTEADFADVTAKEALMLVEFYAPWCGHCKSLAPVYEEAAKQLQTTDPPIKLAKVDATVETSLASKYGVTGYPTLKVFRFGKASEYKGDRTAHGIVDYMEKQRGEGTKEMTSLKALQKAMKEDDITVVGFFKDESSDLFNTYKDLANDQREMFTFLHTFEEAAAAHYAVKQDNMVVFAAPRYSSKYESKSYSLDKADASMEDMLKFVENAMNPLVGHYSYDTKERRYKSARPLVLMFFTVDFSFDHRVATQAWRIRLAEVAKDFRDMTFAIADEDENSDLFKAFGFDESGEEVNIGVLGAKGEKYPMAPFEEFESYEVGEFLKAVQSGNLKPKLRSMAVPKKQKGPVVAVVGKTFEKVVLDKSKDVLIELYAPWCGHCKQFEPEYKKLAKQLKGRKNLVLAKMDAQGNDSPPEYAAEGFPTIYFAPSNSKKSPIKYSGNRDLDDLTKFINDNAVASKQKDEL